VLIHSKAQGVLHGNNLASAMTPECSSSWNQVRRSLCNCRWGRYASGEKQSGCLRAALTASAAWSTCRRNTNGWEASVQGYLENPQERLAADNLKNWHIKLSCWLLMWKLCASASYTDYHIWQKYHWSLFWSNDKMCNWSTQVMTFIEKCLQLYIRMIESTITHLNLTTKVSFRY
jgi:hypothetical protein